MPVLIRFSMLPIAFWRQSGKTCSLNTPILSLNFDYLLNIADATVYRDILRRTEPEQKAVHYEHRDGWRKTDGTIYPSAFKKRTTVLTVCFVSPVL